MGLLGQFLLAMVLVLVGIVLTEAQINTFLINCGSNSSVDIDARKWVGDSSLGNNVTLSSRGIDASTSDYNGNSIYAPLYKTAKLFTDSLNYSFNGVQGSYFVRLHFYPFQFEKYDSNNSYFAVSANGMKLVSEFNVLGEIMKRNSKSQGKGNSSISSLMKEFYFTIETNTLVLEFTPKKDSYGFINAIEIVRVTDNLFLDYAKKVGGSNSSLNLNKRGIQTMYRLNIGGSVINPNQDSDLRRTWEIDSNYMINPDAGSEIRNKSNITYASPSDTSLAPLLVYETARTMSLTNVNVMEKRLNMSWILEVDPDFDYLIRLHFCELVFDKESQRIFRIYIDNKTAVDNFDIFAKAGGMNRAYHEDYLDSTSLESNTLLVQLGPDPVSSSEIGDALLNGLEVFKLSRNGNLAYAESYVGLKGEKGSNKMILFLGIGGGIASVIVLAGLVLLIVRSRKKRGVKNGKKNPPGWRPLFENGLYVSSISNAGPGAKPNGLRSGRRFTLAEMKEATHNFDESLVIGVGGFGKVFKGLIDEGYPVAIKRANPQSQQGLKEFETEIEMLSKLRHKHLVSMIGFCDEQNEMILVYEYMANGTLRSHLFGSDLPELSWRQRIEVCIGAARGLHYLHTGSERGIIHRDVKTTNILLDENFVAKMADFGLSKTGPSLDHTHVSTAVKGSFGYLDPEYFRRQQLTEKSDVYSFGVVLFEVVCARAVINPTLPRDQINLAEWAMRWQREKLLETIIDPKLAGKYSPEGLMKFGEIAEKCLAEEGKSRPTLGEVLWNLEYVLQLQDAWLRSENVEERGPERGQVSFNANEEARLVAITEEERENVGNRVTYQTDHVIVGVDEFSQLDLHGR